MKLNGKPIKDNDVRIDDNYAEAKHERDMLDGNITRMFLSDDMYEIMKMYAYAKFRLNLIYYHCLKMYEERNKDAENR